MAETSDDDPRLKRAAAPADTGPKERNGALLYGCLLMLVSLPLSSLAAHRNGWSTRRHVEVQADARRLNVGEPTDVPAWITVREAAVLADTSIESIAELLACGRVDSAPLLGPEEDPGLVLVRTRDLEWAELCEGDQEHDPEPLSLEVLLDGASSTTDHYVALAASNPPTDRQPSVEQVEVTVRQPEPAPPGRDELETSPEETLRLIARTRTRPGEALPDWSSVEGAPRTDTPALGSR